MGQISVERDEAGVAEPARMEPSQPMCGPNAEFAGPNNNADALVPRSAGLDMLARPVGRSVIDNHNIGSDRESSNGIDQLSDRPTFVISGNTDERVAGANLALCRRASQKRTGHSSLGCTAAVGEAIWIIGLNTSAQSLWCLSSLSRSTVTRETRVLQIEITQSSHGSKKFLHSFGDGTSWVEPILPHNAAIERRPLFGGEL
jgi:hypothetical protein